MNDATLELIAERYLGSVGCEDYVRWAVACLEANIDSKNIRILSSLRKPLYSWEVDDYFERCLADLGWTMPERRECLYEYLHRIVQQVVSRELTTSEASRKIYRIAVALEFPHDLYFWICADPSDFRDSKDWDNAVISEAEYLLENWPPK